MTGTKNLRLLITGGGTGGHLFPAVAIARAFLSADPDTRILFVGTGKAIERSVLAREGFDHRVVAASGFKGMGVWGKAAALWALPRGLAAAWGILSRFAPDLVVGMGSYSAGPVAAAAWLRGVPVVLHEQNAVPGLTNRVLCRIARRVLVSLPESADWFPAGKVRVTGNPVRPELLTGPLPESGSPAGPFTVMVAGGSQGARALNRAVVDMLGGLSDPGAVAFIHQTGPADEAGVRDAYRRRGVEADVRAFFTDMKAAYRAADLVVCRAGATTLAELACLGKPSVLVPYPHAADNHQEKNAMSLVRSGAAEMIREADLTPEGLLERIDAYRRSPDRLARMAARASGLARPDAAARIVSACMEVLRNRAGEPARPR